MGTVLVRCLCPEVFSPEYDEYVLKAIILFMASFADMMLRMSMVLFVVFTLAACDEVLTKNGQGSPDEWELQSITVEPRSRLLRDQQVSQNGTGAKEKKKCGPTAIRLKMDLNRIYGEWFPAEASEMAYQLWLTSLYGFNSSSTMTSIICPKMRLTPGAEAETLNIQISHKDKRVDAQAAFLGDDRHPGTSKWVISWPNGEDTLTSIVACGSTSRTDGFSQVYEWMLTVDCDLNGIVSPDWTIFSRKGGLPSKTIEAIKALVDGIAGLSMTNTKNPVPE